MLFMIIERFDDALAIGLRFREHGRMIPEGSGVEYVASWMTADGKGCYQLMESPTREALDPWMHAWRDLGSFEVVEVRTSREFWADFWAGRGEGGPKP